LNKLMILIGIFMYFGDPNCVSPIHSFSRQCTPPNACRYWISDFLVACRLGFCLFLLARWLSRCLLWLGIVASGKYCRFDLFFGSFFYLRRQSWKAKIIFTPSQCTHTHCDCGCSRNFPPRPCTSSPARPRSAAAPRYAPDPPRTPDFHMRAPLPPFRPAA
jgi:hypothetical protein